MKTRFQIAAIFGIAALAIGAAPGMAEQLSNGSAETNNVEGLPESSVMVPPVRRVAPRMPDNTVKPKSAPSTAKAKPPSQPKKKPGN